MSSIWMLVMHAARNEYTMASMPYTLVNFVISLVGIVVSCYELVGV